MKNRVLALFKKKYLFFILGLVVIIAGIFLYGVKRVDGKIKEVGDYVYSKEVKIKTGSGDEDYSTISGYSGFDWGEISSLMDVNAMRLENEYARSMSGSAFNWSNINPSNKPEGQVWSTSDGLNINSDINIGGKGTIIITNGDLNINANMSYASSNSSVGFIVLNGNVNIAKDVSTVGAYYSSNQIVFN